MNNHYVFARPLARGSFRSSISDGRDFALSLMNWAERSDQEAGHAPSPPGRMILCQPLDFGGS